MSPPMRWRNIFAEIEDEADEPWSNLVYRLQRAYHSASVYIQPYLGYGTAELFYIRGRVLEGAKLKAAEADATLWENLAATYRRFETDEVPHAQIQVTLGEETSTTVTDREGYFAIEVVPPATLLAETERLPLWHEVAMSTPATSDKCIAAPVTSRVMVPPATSTFGVISDLDDTVLQTHATSFLQMAKLTLLHNAHTRLPFAGVAEFYQALQRGSRGTEQNPIFYVSSSPWNLYDLLVEFLGFHNIPYGPLFLRDFAFNRALFGPAGHQRHKLAQVEHLLTVYHKLPFVLIGDSGQADPEIYREVVRRFPDRIAAIYIRDVSLDERDVEVDRIIQEISNTKTPMLRVADTVTAAEHAAAAGLLDPAALSTIRVGKQSDTAE